MHEQSHLWIRNRPQGLQRGHGLEAVLRGEAGRDHDCDVLAIWSIVVVVVVTILLAVAGLALVGDPPLSERLG